MPQIPPLECMVSEVHVRSVKILARLELSGLSRSPLLFFSGLRPLGFLTQFALLKLGGDSPVQRLLNALAAVTFNPGPVGEKEHCQYGQQGDTSRGQSDVARMHQPPLDNPQPSITCRR